MQPETNTHKNRGFIFPSICQTVRNSHCVQQLVSAFVYFWIHFNSVLASCKMNCIFLRIQAGPSCNEPCHKIPSSNALHPAPLNCVNPSKHFAVRPQINSLPTLCVRLHCNVGNRVFDCSENCHPLENNEYEFQCIVVYFPTSSSKKLLVKSKSVNGFINTHSVISIKIASQLTLSSIRGFLKKAFPSRRWLHECLWFVGVIAYVLVICTRRWCCLVEHFVDYI